MYLWYYTKCFITYLVLTMIKGIKSNILYGGILGEKLLGATLSDSDVAEVVRFATDTARKYQSVIRPGIDMGDENSEPVVYQVHKEKLHYTVDGKTHFIKEEHNVIDGKQIIHKRRAIIGINFRLSLSFQNSSYIHEFLITKDRAHALFVFQHTFYRMNSKVCSKYNSSSKKHNIGHVTEYVTIGDSIDGHVILSNQPLASILRTNPLFPECHISESYSTSHWKVLPNETQKDFKVLSYNIWNFNSVGNHPQYYLQRIDKLGKLVASSLSDIIALQEVRFDQSQRIHIGPAQVQHLTDYLNGYQFVYQPAVSYFSDELLRVEEGLAIYSKHPILSHDYILLSRNTSDAEDSVHQRICLRAEIDMPNIGNVHVFVTHLSLSATARLRSVREIWDYMNTVKGPAVLVGDFNDEPQGKPIQFLSGKTDINGAWTNGLKDAWSMLHSEPRPDVPGFYKANEKRDYGLTFNRLDENLRKRIDYIFLRLPKHLDLRDVSLLEDEGWSRKATSDHLAVQAVLKRTG